MQNGFSCYRYYNTDFVIHFLNKAVALTDPVYIYFFIYKDKPDDGAIYVIFRGRGGMDFFN